MPSGIILSIRSDKPISRQILCVQAPHAHTSVITSHRPPCNGQILLKSWVTQSRRSYSNCNTANIALIKSSSNWGYGKLFDPRDSREKEYSHLKTAIIVKQWTFEKVQCSCCQYGSLSKTYCCSAWMGYLETPSINLIFSATWLELSRKSLTSHSLIRDARFLMRPRNERHTSLKKIVRMSVI